MKNFELRVAMVPVLLAVANGCAGEDFDPYNRLNSLRVLAIKSEPVAPGPGETTTLSPLLYVPQGQSEPELSWSWCPFPGGEDDGFPCEVQEEDLRGFGDALQLPPLELGIGTTATLENTLSPDAARWLCEGGLENAPRPDCEDGLQVQVKLRVKTDKDEVVAVRKLRLRFEAESAGNANPEIDGVEAKLKGEWVSLDEELDKLVPRDEKSNLRAKVTEPQAEDYESHDDEGQAETRSERLVITWFVEAGSTTFEHTAFTQGVTTLDTLRENDWKPARSSRYASNAAELILVLRDDRDGVGWYRSTVKLEEVP